MVRPLIIGGAAVAIAAGGFSLGRWAAPARVETRERVVERQVKAQEDRAEDREKLTVAHVQGVKRIVRYIEHPDGRKEREEREEVLKKQKATAAKERVVVKTVIEYRDRVVEKERIVTRDVRANYALAGSIGLGLDGRPRYSAGVERRLIGPVWAGVQATSERAVMVNLRWEF